VLDRLNAWLVVIAVFVGVGSVSTTIVLTSRSDEHNKRQACVLVQRSNAQTRDFVSAILSDPSVDVGTRTRVSGLAFKYFPIEDCR